MLGLVNSKRGPCTKENTPPYKWYTHTVLNDLLRATPNDLAPSSPPPLSRKLARPPTQKKIEKRDNLMTG